MVAIAGTTTTANGISASAAQDIAGCPAFAATFLLPWASHVNVTWGFASSASMGMLNEVDVSFSSGAGGSNYMGWQNAHVAQQLVVGNTGIRDNRPFYVNVRTTAKNNAVDVMSFGPVVMAHVTPAKGTVACARDSSGDWTLTMANFNTGSETYTYHTLLKSGSKTLVSLPNQACALRTCRVAVDGSAVAAVTQFVVSVHACNLLGVCTDSTSGTCVVPADGGSAKIEHVWEASDALQGSHAVALKV